MKWEFRTGGIPDEMFIRGKVPMTKAEIRAVTLSKLKLKDSSRVADVGSGTGSIAIEVAHICTKGRVFAIERNPEGIELIRKNCEAFGVTVEILHGNGSECLKRIDTVDRMIIGGSGGELDKILTLAQEKLSMEGICVINCITVETLYEAKSTLKEKGFQSIDVISLSIARGKQRGNYTIMEAINPIYILTGIKREL